MKASPSASSAAATSCVRVERYATSRPYDRRTTNSTTAFGSSTGPLHPLTDLGRDRTDLDCAGRCRRAAGGPFERRVKGRRLQDDEAAELLLGVGIGPVLHLPLR